MLRFFMIFSEGSCVRLARMRVALTQVSAHLNALLEHIAKLPGELHAAAPRHVRNLDEKYADRSRQSCRPQDR